MVALGAEVVKQRAAKGDGEAQFSQGFLSVSAAGGGDESPLGTGGRTPKADVGLASAPHSLRSLTIPRRIDVVT